MTLYELTGQFKQLLEMIESGEMSPEDLKDTLEGLEGEIEVKADGYAKIMRELEGQATVLSTEIDRLSQRKTSLTSNIKTMKESLQKAMESTGKTKFKTDLFSFGIQNNPPSLVIDNPDSIPEEFLIPQAPKVDNSKIKELLKTTSLSFAHLEQGQSLRIR